MNQISIPRERGAIPDILNAPWAILPEKLEEIHAVYQAHLQGETPDLSRFRAAMSGEDDEEGPPYEVVNGVAVIPVVGTIARRMNLFSLFSGGTSIELLMRDFAAALADTSVDAILLSVDSPGGAVGGTMLLSDAIHAARGQKPVVAFASDMMASAAYWIGSAADLVIAEETSVVGSIGVVTVHYDYSRQDEARGIKRTFVAAGRYKAIGNDAEALSVEGRQVIQDRLDYLYSLFVGGVARNRNRDVQAVLDGMADGRVFIGRQAQAAGLVDAIGTIDDALFRALSMVRTERPQYLIRR